MVGQRHSELKNADDFRQRIQYLHQRLTKEFERGVPPTDDLMEGPHWALGPGPGPRSVGRVEAHFLYNIAHLITARTFFEIGTGFGYSSWWLGAGLLPSAERWGGSLDRYSVNSPGIAALEFARTGARVLGLDAFINYFIGESPAAVPGCIGNRTLDIALIDGYHRGDQPRLDYEAVREHLAQDAIMIFHDVRPPYSVELAVQMAEQEGWIRRHLHTSCSMAACARVRSLLPAIDEAYQRARSHELIS